MAKYPYSNDRDLIARGLFLKQNLILVNQNVNRKTGEAYVALPGGHVDPGEDCQTALAREIEEELDGKANVGDLLFVSESIYAGRSHEEKKRHELTLVFAAEISGERTEGDRVLSPETDKNFRWLPLSAVPEANLLPAAIKEFVISHLKLAGPAAESPRYVFQDSTR